MSHDCKTYLQMAVIFLQDDRLKSNQVSCSFDRPMQSDGEISHAPLVVHSDQDKSVERNDTQSKGSYVMQKRNKRATPAFP